MKATLTIEVPDEFKKGDCRKCDYECFGSCIAKEVLRMNQIDSCPLEIQYDTNEFSEREIELMKQGKVISHRPKGNNQ